MMCMIICSILSQLLQNQDIRHVCRKFNIRVVRWTLRSMLTKVKDTLDYLLIQCGISYPLQLRPSLHRRDQTETGDETEGTPRCLQRGMMEKSAVAEHAWEHHHPIHREETTVLDHDRGQELLVKEALHI